MATQMTQNGDVSKEKPWLYCNLKNNPTLANLQLMPPDITVGEAKQRYRATINE